MADRYWVGGTANWDATAGTKWATTSGGAGGAAVPTSADNVFFDAASGAVTVTVSATANCLDLNFTGFTGTFAGSSVVNIYGSFVAVAAMTWTKTSSLDFRATTTGKTITTNGKTLTSSINFAGAGGEWTLQDALTVSSANGISFQAGSFITNNNNINANTFNSNLTTTKSITLGSSTLTATASAGGFDFASGTNLTINAGTSTLIVGQAGSLTSTGFTFYNVSFTTGSTTSGNSSISGNNTFNNLSIIPSSGFKTITLSGNQTVNGTFTSTGNTVRYRNTIKSNSTTARTITAAAISIQDTDFEYITGAGAASPFSLSTQRVGNCGGNSGITFPTAVNRYAVVPGNYYDTAMWSTTSGGSGGASVPLPQDTAYFNASSAAGTYTLNLGSRVNTGTIDCTGFTRTLAGSAGTITNIYGSLILSSGMTFTPSTSTFNFVGNGTYNIDCQGQSLYVFSIFPLNGTYSLNSNITSTASSATNIPAGTFNTNNFNISVFTLSISNTANVNLGSSQLFLSGTGSAFFNSTSGSFSAGTSTINLTNTTTTAKTFSGGSKTYYNLVISGTGISDTQIDGSNTFNSISVTKPNASTLTFTAGSTNTVTNFNVAGSVGNIVTITRFPVTAAANLVKAGGGYIVVDYASINNISASPSSTWYATNSTDGGGNSGWTFGAAPSTGNSLFFGNNF